MPVPVSEQVEVPSLYEGIDDLFAPTRSVDDIRCEGEIVDLDSLVQDPMNARLHPNRNMEAICESLRRYGQKAPLVVREQNRVIAAGNGRHRAMKMLGWTKCAVSMRPMTDAEFYGFALADNRTAELANWDLEMVAKIEQLVRLLGEPGLVGFDDREMGLLLQVVSGQNTKKDAGPNLAERFLVPPFSVLDARQGYWQDRKKKWLELGIESELGRTFSSTSDQAFRIDVNGKTINRLSPGGSPMPAMRLGEDGRTLRGDGRGDFLDASGVLFKSQNHLNNIMAQARSNTSSSVQAMLATGMTGAHIKSGTSIFDPVLCELAYRWFSPVNGTILDPFAGGSVRGIVASKLDRDYTGIELRPEQVEANEAQAKKIVPNRRPKWFAEDSRNVRNLLPNQTFDLIFSCPPYFDLEVYSDDPRDISAMTYEQFLEVYRLIIKESCSLLKNNSFACFVVANMRNKATGTFRDFVGDTIKAFEDAGLAFHNDAILVTMVGSLPIRTGNQFSGSRKLGKTHQNVLTFVKGNQKLAVEKCGTVEISDLSNLLKEGSDETFLEVISE